MVINRLLFQLALHRLESVGKFVELALFEQLLVSQLRFFLPHRIFPLNLAVEVPLRERGKRLNALVRYMHETAPKLPLWFGGRADAVLRRVARSGSGYIASTSSGVEGFASRWRTLQQYVVKAGREPSAVTPAAPIHFSVDSDAARARERMHSCLTRSYGPERAADLGPLTGNPDDLVRGAEAYFKAGVEVLICSSITKDFGALEMFAERVLPRLYL